MPKTKALKVGETVTVSGRTNEAEIREIGKDDREGEIRVTFPDATTAWYRAELLSRPGEVEDEDDTLEPKTKAAKEALAVVDARASEEADDKPNVFVDTHLPGGKRRS